MNGKPSNSKDNVLRPQDFDSLKISIASPEEILSISHGEISKPETINYRTQKPERDGLFDEKIFGPVKDYECYCGKYRKIRYKGVVCDKCGVEVTKSSVRRERMGHIDLAVPIAHVWFVRGIPSTVGLLLDLSVSDLEKVIYFASYLILSVNDDMRQTALAELEEEFHSLKSKKDTDFIKIEEQYRKMRQELNQLAPAKVVSELTYHELSLRYGDIVRVSIGAEAIFEVLRNFNIKEKLTELQRLEQNATPAAKRKIIRRIKLLSDLDKNNVKPFWFMLSRLPVIPPDLRPMVQLDGGRFAASDLNDLYRRIINRNNRLKRLLTQGAPEVIVRNEKRMLQEAVDALIDNAVRRGKTAQAGPGNRKLRSLSDMLRGKQGLFRQNLLGKRVDYSGRSVIVAGPELKLGQCGLPKMIALELFKPFVVSRLIRDGFVHNIRNASKAIERGDPQVWDILEQITKESYVLLNRAPTLHRLGIQAFQPILIEGKAIKIHPLVCSAYNADFDGDQMAVHLPLSKQANEEARDLMHSVHNLLKPASGEPIVNPRIDMIVGCYYLTTIKPGAPGEGKLFSSKNEAILAYHQQVVHVRAKIKVRIAGEIMETTVGRILFNNILPENSPFANQVMDNKALKKIVNDCLLTFGKHQTVELVDKIKDLGFHYAGVSGLTISMDDVYIPPVKHELLEKGQKLVDQIEDQFRKGLITDDERRFKIIETWTLTRSEIEKALVEQYNKESPVYQMVSSGARGSFAQIIQMGGMKGLVVSPTGEIIPLPIKASFKEGLSMYEYFISTHGARKGKSDTSLRTSDAGYLTRRLVDVAQDIVVALNDCGVKVGRAIKYADSASFGHEFYDRLLGRVALTDIKGIAKANEIIDENAAKMIIQNRIEEVIVRSPAECVASWGICQLCYGRDLATGKLVQLGEAVGIIAAQAIGEPGTQLTMKTFHLGGVTGEDITTGLPRVEELFEARAPKRPAMIAEYAGKIHIAESGDQYILSVVTNENQVESVKIPDGYSLIISDGDKIKAKQLIASYPGRQGVRAASGGVAAIFTNYVTITNNDKRVIEYQTPNTVGLLVKNGDQVARGDLLTQDHVDLHQAIKLQSKQQLQDYIMSEVQKIYMAQGQVINDKHLEIILRQMFSKVRVADGGDSGILAGQIIDRLKINQINKDFAKNGKKIIASEDIVLGITRISLKTDSFLSAASFQETTSVLIDAAIRGSVDHLRGLKENVIIGRLIPAGTGFSHYFPEKVKDAND